MADTSHLENKDVSNDLQSEKKKGLHPAIVVFLVIFFPIGILYLITRINKFLISRKLQHPPPMKFHKIHQYPRIDSYKGGPTDPTAYRPGTAFWNSLHRK